MNPRGTNCTPRGTNCTPRGTYCTSYCNQAHRLSNGRPYKHECRTIPPAALQAERAGDFAKAIAILAATPVERVTPRQGVPRDSLPAVETCQQRGYGPGTLLASESWQRPRRIVEVQSKYVVLVTAGKSGKDRVRSLPKDAFVVEKP